jgi:hypothetical protein
VIPEPLAAALETDKATWFVIGGQAVRCLSPYRPSRDTDVGVPDSADLQSLLEHLHSSGDCEVTERTDDTVHLRYRGINVSIFVLPLLCAHTEGKRLSVDGILATKLHAILDRGARRDFFDLYVVLQQQRLGIAAALSALRVIYAQEVNDSLLLRALCYFDDAEREAPLPGEAEGDLDTVRNYFLRQVADLLVPPTAKLGIQTRVVDLRP